MAIRTPTTIYRKPEGWPSRLLQWREGQGCHEAPDSEDLQRLDGHGLCPRK